MSAMDKYIEGYTTEADYCPKCRADTASYHADGSNKCSNCGYVFYLVEKESEA
jgi:ribosomal protein L37AE/L43A